VIAKIVPSPYQLSDGTHFVIGEVLDNDTNHRMFIVENWFEEFKEQQN